MCQDIVRIPLNLGCLPAACDRRSVYLKLQTRKYWMSPHLYNGNETEQCASWPSNGLTERYISVCEYGHIVLMTVHMASLGWLRWYIGHANTTYRRRFILHPRTAEANYQFYCDVFNERILNQVSALDRRIVCVSLSSVPPTPSLSPQ